MMEKRILLTPGLIGVGLIGVASVSHAQIPDLLNSLDAGSRSMGAGSAFGVTSADTFSILNNPAGLGYASGKSFGISYRNLPTSTTQMFGSLANPTLTSDGGRGKNAITHLGYTMPLKSGGTLGISYQVGGYVNDTRSGTNLTSGGFNNVTYTENIRAKTDYYTVSLGKANEDGTKSFGYGLTFASFDFSDDQFGFIPGNPQTILIDNQNRATATGIGLVVGTQFVPKGKPNTTVGASLRSPIKLNGSSVATNAISTLPGQINLGFASRIDNFRGKEDYLVYGAQVSHFFGGSSGIVLDRNGQTTLGFGGEYNLVKDSGTIPIRLGYILVPSGGSGFSARNALTFGAGYRPAGQPWGIDINYAYPNSGGSDFALSLSYRFEK